MLKKLLAFLVALAAVPAVYVFIREAVKYIFVDAYFQQLQWLGFGFAAYIIAYPFAPRRISAFVEHFEHELGHAAVALLFFRNISEFNVNPAQGSHVRHEQGFNLMIRLAPYYLPLFSLVLVGLKPFVFPSAYEPLDFLIGASLAFHFVGVGREFRPKQSDISKSGLLPSILVTCLMNTIFLVVILSIAGGEYSEIWEYLKGSLLHTRDAYLNPTYLLR